MDVSHLVASRGSVSVVPGLVLTSPSNICRAGRNVSPSLANAGSSITGSADPANTKVSFVPPALVVPSGLRSLLAQDARDTARAAEASTASDFLNELWNFNAYTSNLAGNARRWSSICWSHRALAIGRSKPDTIPRAC